MGITTRPLDDDDAAFPMAPDLLLGLDLEPPAANLVGADEVALSAQARPTVFRQSSTIHLATSRSGPVALRIADVSGRIVRTLIDGSLAAGAHEIVWDGRDGSGRSVAAGVYFYQLRAGAAERTGRLVRIR